MSALEWRVPKMKAGGMGFGGGCHHPLCKSKARVEPIICGYPVPSEVWAAPRFMLCRKHQAEWIVAWNAAGGKA